MSLTRRASSLCSTFSSVYPFLKSAMSKIGCQVVMHMLARQVFLTGYVIHIHLFLSVQHASKQDDRRTVHSVHYFGDLLLQQTKFLFLFFLIEYRLEQLFERTFIVPCRYGVSFPKKLFQTHLSEIMDVRCPHVDALRTFISGSVLRCRPVSSVRHSHWITSVFSLKNSLPLRSV